MKNKKTLKMTFDPLRRPYPHGRLFRHRLRADARRGRTTRPTTAALSTRNPKRKTPLTPDGNATLVDDFGGNKQLITVTTKNGNYFYILIDRDDEGENTVHFLNQVDEADLMALIEDGNTTTEPPAVCNCTEKCEAGKVNVSCPVCKDNMTTCSGKAAEPEQGEPEEPKEKKTGTGGLLLFLIVAIAGGGGAFYYFKIMKPKQDVKGGTDLDDFDFDDYDEDEPEPDDEAGDDGETEDEEA